MEFIHSAFQKLITDTQIIAAFFYAMAGFCALLVAIDAMRTYSNIVVHNKIEPWQIAKPIFVILLIISWKWIYMGLNSGFDSITYYFNEFLIQKITKTDGKVIDQLFKEIGTDSKFSVFEVSLGSFMMSLLAFTLGFLHWLIDIIISLYLDINDLLLALFAPIAVVLLLLKETSNSFATWLKLFAKFRLFMLAVIACDFLGILFTRYVKDALTTYMEVPPDMLALSGVSNMINVVCLTAFIVFKLIFLICAFKLLSALIESGDMSVGGAAGGMVRAIADVTKKVATKGAA